VSAWLIFAGTEDADRGASRCAMLPPEPCEDARAGAWKGTLALAKERFRRQNPDETRLIERALDLCLGWTRLVR